MRRPDAKGDFPGSSACPQCGSSDLRNFAANAHDETGGAKIRVHVCVDCDFAWQWPWRRTTETSQKYFETEYQSAAEGSYFDTGRRQGIAAQQFDYVRSRVDRMSTLLDIGGGDGAFVDVVAAAGVGATGVDPAMPAHRARNGNPNLICGFVDELPAAQKFDVVTMWDVIEHLEDPLAVLKSAAARLAPGGRLFVETGNFQSAGRIESGGDWWCYQADHRWYFAPPVIRQMMAELGLIDIDVCERVLRPWWKGARTAPEVGVARVLKESLKRPHRLFQNIEKFRDLRKCSQRWPEWNGLEIFTISGAMPAQ